MTNEEILKKVIEKAVENGYTGWNMGDDDGKPSYPKLDGQLGRMYATSKIFSHAFAKAFWGEETLDIRDMGFEPITDKTKTTAWKFHLLAMVLEEEPLKYLEKFLDKQ